MTNKEVKDEQLDLLTRFIESDEDTKFSKQDVFEILEAYKYKQLTSGEQSRKRKPRNIMMMTHNLGQKIFSWSFFSEFSLTYVFYAGAFVVVTRFFYSGLFANKAMVFIAALVFTLIDQLLRQYLFVLEFIMFSIHRMGIITLLLFSTVLYLLSRFFGANTRQITYGTAMLISLIAVLSVSLVHHIKQRALFKKMMDEAELDEEEGSDEDV